MCGLYFKTNCGSGGHQCGRRIHQSSAAYLSDDLVCFAIYSGVLVHQYSCAVWIYQQFEHNGRKPLIAADPVRIANIAAAFHGLPHCNPGVSHSS